MVARSPQMNYYDLRVTSELVTGDRKCVSQFQKQCKVHAALS